jgi:GTP-binding protein
MRSIVTTPFAFEAPMSSLLQSARFLTTVVKPSGLPPVQLPEVAFVGRSNAGKSSTMNLLCSQKQMAFASRTPGRTQALNFFCVGPEDAPIGLLVDTPGYGYAKIAKSEKKVWETLAGEYLSYRQSLVSVVLISDIRRGLTAADEILIGFAPTSIPLTVILTKADKLGHGARQTARLQVLAHLKTLGRTANVLLLSNLTRLGLEDAQALVESWIKGE